MGQAVFHTSCAREGKAYKQATATTMGNAQGGVEHQMAVKNNASPLGDWGDVDSALNEMALKRKDGKFAGQKACRVGNIKANIKNERIAAVVWIDVGAGRGSGFYVKYDGY